jgi:magnesium-transporting ATPase (P-type)
MLTLNQMSVVEVWTPLGTVAIEGVGYDPTVAIRAEPNQLSVLRDVALSASYCATGHAVLLDGRWVAQGDPLEAALDVFARRLGIDSSIQRILTEVEALFPFDPRRRRMSAAAGGSLHVKGAPDAVLPQCTNRQNADAALQVMTGRGLRVLAVARRPISRIDPATTAEEIETGLELLGLMAIQDPPRPGITESIAACRRAGIAVAMVTGDHPDTARAIAKQVGLLGAEDWVIEGRNLPQDEARLGALVDRDGIVLSRVTPQDIAFLRSWQTASQ